MPADWAEIEELYWKAVGLDPTERSDFLKTECAGRTELHHEVWSLLQADQNAGSFLESPSHHPAETRPGASVAATMTGRKLGRYRLLSLAGAGNMGAVYRALDLKLNRVVAVKTLPSWLALDDRMRQRMRTEAFAIARLSHPHVCRLYDIESGGGEDFLVMEFVEGETLAARLARGVLPLSEALRIAWDIAGALAAAHAQDIIHRDLKPGNIMLTPAGAVLMDFGLAKTLRGPDKETTTITGMVVGTAAYMSPEQARGETLDFRTDLFSFGLVLFEMLTGHRALPGKTVPEVFAALINNVPSVPRRLAARLPKGLITTVSTCLQPRREARYPSALELKNALTLVLQEIQHRDSQQPTARSRKLVPTVVTLLVVLIAAALSGWLSWRRSGTVNAHARLQSLTANPTELPVLGSAISPDGKYLAWSDPRGLHLSLVATGEEHAIDAMKNLTGLTAFAPIGWLPDGTHFVVNALSGTAIGINASIWLVPAMGGTPMRLQEEALAGSISPAANLIAYTTGGSGLDHEIRILDVNSLQSRSIAGPEQSTGFRGVHWSPDGRRIAYTRMCGKGRSSGLESRDITGSTPMQQLTGGPHYWDDYCWLRDGRIVYPATEATARSGQFSQNLWQVQVDANGKQKGAPRRLTDLTGFTFSNFSISADGRKVAFQKDFRQSDVFVAKLEAGGTRLQYPQRLTMSELDDRPTAWTPDGTAVIFGSNRNGSWGIFKQGLGQDRAETLVSGLSEGPLARLTPDGRSIFYADKSRIMSLRLDGGAPKLVTHASSWNHACAQLPSTFCMVSGLTPDEKSLKFEALDMDTGRRRELFRLPREIGIDYNSALSPDGRWIAVVNTEPRSARIQLYSTSGQHVRDISVEKWTLLGSVDFAADSKAVFVSSLSPMGSSVVRVDLKGHATALWSQTGVGNPVTWAIASPDGRHLAIMGWTSDRNVWLMENP